MSTELPPKPNSIPLINRRTFLAGVGAAGLALAGCNPGKNPSSGPEATPTKTTLPGTNPTERPSTTVPQTEAPTTILKEPSFMSALLNVDYQCLTEIGEVQIELLNPVENSHRIMEQFLIVVLAQRAREQNVANGLVSPVPFVPTSEEIASLKAEIDANGGVLENFRYPIRDPNYHELEGAFTHLAVSEATKVDLNYGLTARRDPNPNPENCVFNTSNNHERYEIGPNGDLQFVMDAYLQPDSLQGFLAVFLELLSVTDSKATRFVSNIAATQVGYDTFDPKRATVDSNVFGNGSELMFALRVTG